MAYNNGIYLKENHELAWTNYVYHQNIFNSTQSIFAQIKSLNVF